MTFASVCTGIGGFDLGFIQAGHTPLWFCENDKACQAALKNQFPNIPCYDDVNQLHVDTSAKVVYSLPYGQTNKELPGGDPALPIWSICGRCSGVLWSEPTSNVGMDGQAKNAVQKQNPERRAKPFSSGGEGQQPKSHGNGRASNRKRVIDPTLGLRSVRQKLCSCEQPAANRGASPGLQQTSGSEMAMQEMSFRVAQNKQGNQISIAKLDALCGGFPCQDVSIAGQRKGLTHDKQPTRSGLFYRICELADAIGQRWTILENVPGLFSSHAGRDFAAVVGELSGATIDVPREGWTNAGVALGPKGLVEWGVLDSQYFGLAQRRKRVFIIRDSGDWASRPPIFLERQSLSGNSPPRRQAGQRVAPTVEGRAGRSGENGFNTSGGLCETAPTLPARKSGGGGVRNGL